MPPARVAVVGLGSAAAQLHLPALAHLIARGRAEVVAVVDRNPARRDWFTASDFALAGSRASIYDDLATALRDQRPDMVIIGTPPETHTPLSLQAVESGAHVLCEKPIAPTLVEADHLVAAAARTGRVIAVNNQYRRLSFVRAARAAIDAGRFGRPYLMQVWQQMPSPGQGFPDWKAALDRLILYEFGTHAIDLITFLFGGPLGPDQRAGDALPRTLSTRILRPDPSRLDLVSTTRFDFGREAVAMMTLNWRSNAPQRYLEVRLDCERASLRISLGGVARLRLGWSADARRPEVAFSLVKGGETRVEQRGASFVLAQERGPAWIAATADTIEHVIDCAQTKRTPENDVGHARDLLRAALATYESAEQGGALIDLGASSAVSGP